MRDLTGVYLNIPAGVPGYKGTYTGLLRLMPIVTATQTSRGWDTQVTIQVALLGQRLMFGKALEWLN